MSESTNVKAGPWEHLGNGLWRHKYGAEVQLVDGEDVNDVSWLEDVAGGYEEDASGIDDQLELGGPGMAVGEIEELHERYDTAREKAKLARVLANRLSDRRFAIERSLKILGAGAQP